MIQKLIELSNKNQKQYNEQLIGKNVEVLFEDEEIDDGVTYYKGHTQNYILVKYKTDENNLFDSKIALNELRKLGFIPVYFCFFS